MEAERGGKSSMEYADIAPIMGRLWSPLAAVTSHWQGRDNVQIAVAIAAASIVPERPRVVVQLYKTNLSHDMVLSNGAFALNFLRPNQLDLIGDFGLVSGRVRDKLAGVGTKAGSSGSPLLTDCFGYLDCRVINAMDGGDMTCFLADVLDGKTLAQGDPLWWRDARRELPREWLERWEAKQSSEIATSRATMDKISHTSWQPK
jgi:flavin reductase (DIM6/NTAB) family NADH-FMN oxidoreductase RutF